MRDNEMRRLRNSYFFKKCKPTLPCNGEVLDPFTHGNVHYSASVHEVVKGAMGGSGVGVDCVGLGSSMSCVNLTEPNERDILQIVQPAPRQRTPSKCSSILRLLAR